jgi:hypothetical protein
MAKAKHKQQNKNILLLGIAAVVLFILIAMTSKMGDQPSYQTPSMIIENQVDSINSNEDLDTTSKELDNTKLEQIDGDLNELSKDSSML